MIKFLAGFFLVLYTFTNEVISADIPKKLIGVWDIQVETTSGFPWWNQIKYPVKLSIKKNGIVFEDQAGISCTPKVFFYDDEIDSVIFKHCIPVKSNIAFPPFYRIAVVGGKLHGEVWIYKLLFRVKGELVESR